MTDESLATDGPAPRPTGGGLAATVAPEGLAAVLSVVVVAVLLIGRLALSGGGGATPSPAPSQAASAAAATPSPGVDVAAINELLNVNRALQGEVATLKLKTPPVAVDVAQGSLVRIAFQLNSTGDPAAARLEASHGGEQVGRAVGSVYHTLHTQMDQVNGLALTNAKGWATGANEIAQTLATLPDLDRQLQALLVSATAPSPSAGASPEVSPSVSAPASPSVTPSPSVAPYTPPPATPSPSPSVRPSGSPQPSPSLGPSLLADGSFESGVGSPWQLIVSDPAAMGSVTSDPVDPHSPTAAARIDISSPSSRQIGIAYQQGGFAVEASAIYRVTIALRSTDVRDVRIRIAEGVNVLDSRVFTINTQWTVETFDFSSFVGSASAVFSIDVGRSPQSVWVDDVSIARVPPG